MDIAVLDPDLEIGGAGGHPDPEIRMGGAVPKKNFSALWDSVLSKNRGEQGWRSGESTCLPPM